MTIEEINEIFADNTSGSITAEDLRSFAVSTKSESTQTNIRIDELTEVVDKKSNTESELKRVEDPENPEFFSWRLKEYDDQYPESVKNSNDNVNLGFNISTAGILKDNDYPAVNGSLNNVLGFANTVSGFANNVTGIFNIIPPRFEYNDNNELQSIKNNTTLWNNIQGVANIITGGINVIFSNYNQNDDNKIKLNRDHQEYFELLEIDHYIYISYVYWDYSKYDNEKWFFKKEFGNVGHTRVKIIDKDDQYIYLEGPWLPEDINYDYDQILSITREEDIIWDEGFLEFSNIAGNFNTVENYLNTDGYVGPNIFGSHLIGSCVSNSDYTGQITYLGRYNQPFKFTSHNMPTLIVGIGTDARLRKNGFIVENSGRVLAPECIVDQPKCLTSKEYVDDLALSLSNQIEDKFNKHIDDFNETVLKNVQGIFTASEDNKKEFKLEVPSDFNENIENRASNYSIRVYKNRILQLKNIDYDHDEPEDNFKIIFKKDCKENDEIIIDIDYLYHKRSSKL